MKNLIAIAIFAIFAGSVSAQESAATPPQCFEPLAHTFDEFAYSSTSLKSHAKEFEEKLKESNESQGIIYVFGGKHSKINELNEMSAAALKAFDLGGSGPTSKLWVMQGGYREVPTIVFLLRPQKCSEFTAPTADLSVDQVEFADFPASTTKRVGENDLLATLIHAPDTECPPAAKAVRACNGADIEVFIIVDIKGNVTFSQAMSGHPLLRKAAETAARKWVFRVFKEEGKPMNRSGTITVKFSDTPETAVDN